MLRRAIPLLRSGRTQRAKRVNFISIQNSQTTHAVGYTPIPTRTGYERVIAHRVDDLFAKIAEQDGTVEAINSGVMTIRYKDGSTSALEIGRRFGKVPKDLAAHQIETDLKVGDKVKKGDVLCYNSNYFTKDKLDPKQIILKPGVLAKTALMETTDTLDDSCAISADFAKKLQTNATHVRVIKVAFEQEIKNLLAVDSDVEVDSILCTIHNPSGGNKELFDEKVLETLKAISSLTPKAKYNGKIERIEVFYAGEVEDMSPSLRELTDISDRLIVRRSKQLGKPAATGQVEAGFRVEGLPLEMDTAAIKVYITGPVDMGVGDKGVFGNQLKTIVGRVMTGVNETQDGQPIDAIFGYQSIANRIVLSPELTGTLNSLLVEVGKRAVKAYRGK